MAIKLKQTISEDKSKGSFEKSEKLTVEGDYELEVVGARFSAEDERFADRYFIDLRVISGPDMVGKLTAYAKFMQVQYRDSKLADGKVFTAKQKMDKDAEGVQVAFAAVVGLSRDNAGQLAEGGKFEGAFEKAFFDKDQSDIAGRKVLGRVKADKKGYKELVLTPYAGASVVAKKAPPAPSSRPSFAMAAAKAGFELRTDIPGGWYYNEETEEQLDEADLKAKLGY